MRLIALGTSILLLSGCASDEAASPPRISAATASACASWTDSQLEVKAADIKRHIAAIQSAEADTSMAGALIGRSRTEDYESQLSAINAEMMRRDPSGKLLDQSAKM